MPRQYSSIDAAIAAIARKAARRKNRMRSRKQQHHTLGECFVLSRDNFTDWPKIPPRPKAEIKAKRRRR